MKVLRRGSCRDQLQCAYSVSVLLLYQYHLHYEDRFMDFFSFVFLFLSFIHQIKQTSTSGELVVNCTESANYRNFLSVPIWRFTYRGLRVRNKGYSFAFFLSVQ